MSYFHSLNRSDITPTFNPGSYLAGYDWDIDPSAITGADGDPVVDAPDVSGAGKHYGQNTTARQPIIKRALYNGRDAIRFSTNRCLVPDPSGRDWGTANTLICICTRSSAADYIIKGTQSGGGPALISKFNPGSGIKDFEYFNGNGLERGTFAASASGLHILTVTHTDDTGNYKLYFDDTGLTPSAVNGAADWNGHSCSIIGAFTAGSSVYDGDIARIFHFNQNHDGASGLADLLAAAKTFWGI